MTISQIVLVSAMLSKLREASRRGAHVYEEFVELLGCMNNVQKYYVSDEVQSSIISNKRDETNPTAMRVQGNFSWGFEKSKEQEESKEMENTKKEEETKEKVDEGKKLDQIMTLKNIDLDIKQGEFVIIVG